MVHIDPGLMRIRFEASLAPARLVNDPSSSLYSNLSGRYASDVFDWQSTDLLSSFGMATIVAHEQRHYIDYLLTNYGSYLARFWPTIKSLMPYVLDYSGKPVIPLSYWPKPGVAQAADSPFPMEGSARSAALLAHNHKLVLNEDQFTKLSRWGKLSGLSQLEAMATVFEVGPAEMHLDPSDWMSVGAEFPRDLATWNQGYVWPSLVFPAFGIGRSPERLRSLPSHERVVETRLWPPVITAALMGRFTELTSARTRANPSIWQNVLPSERLMRLLKWLNEKYKGKLIDFPAMWEAVNEACISLFGEDVIESMDKEVSACELKIGTQMAEAPDHELSYDEWQILKHVNVRRLLVGFFSEDPSRLLDPISFWESDLLRETSLVPDYFLTNKHGFSHIPDGLTAFESGAYSAPTEALPAFLKAKPATQEDQNVQSWDEDITAIARFYVSGYNSKEWVGPELDIIGREIIERYQPYIVPVYTSRRASFESAF